MRRPGQREWLRSIRADRRAGFLLGGVMLGVLLALGATVALPASDPEVRAAEGARTFGEAEQRGFEVYRNEGCWYCHTQSVRTTPVDRPYGEPLEAAAYAEQSPSMLGVERIGPDLTHVGSRYGSAAELISILRRAEGRPSLMPSYAYLSEADLEALAAYLLALQ